MDEIFERISICDGDKRLGYASVRYPVTENRRIDKYYVKLAQEFLKKAETERFTGALNCRISYADEKVISVITDGRLYSGCECVRRHRSSFVWDKKRGILRYLRKWGMRYCNLIYNGRELSIFN